MDAAASAPTADGLARPFAEEKRIPTSAVLDNLTRSLASFAVFNPRRRSLLRGNLLVLGSFAAAFLLSGFPHSRANPLLSIPAALAIVGLVDTVRCVQPRWNFYHGGVMLCLFMDLMAVCLILFFLFFPYLL